jgi:hypothetical protein
VKFLRARFSESVSYVIEGFTMTCGFPKKEASYGNLLAILSITLLYWLGVNLTVFSKVPLTSKRDLLFSLLSLPKFFADTARELEMDGFLESFL